MAILVKSATLSGDKNRWGTMWNCFYDAQTLYGRDFILDVAAEPQTTKTRRYYTSAEWFDRCRVEGDFQFSLLDDLVGFDGLQCDWEPHWWCNPPFDQKAAFIAKAIEEARKGNPGMMLLPYEPLTKWWRSGVEGHASAIYEPDGRYNFFEPDGKTGKSGVNFGCVFVLFTPGYFPHPQRIRFERGIFQQKDKDFAA
ncbi:MAG: hypothetical protein CENE_00002 [Candidatus Celerinatantimonas neptuna]|nr:MAG: hypothetical protein CENE_00002 [Candidatus Celerinatantimonas neptuna]